MPHRKRSGFAELRHEVAAAACCKLVDDVVGDPGEARLKRDDELRREGGIGETPQSRMIIARVDRHGDRAATRHGVTLLAGSKREQARQPYGRRTRRSLAESLVDWKHQ